MLVLIWFNPLSTSFTDEFIQPNRPFQLKGQPKYDFYDVTHLTALPSISRYSLVDMVEL